MSKPIEKKEDVYNALCSYDERSPYYLKPDEWEDKREPRKNNCGCDFCFYGRDEMALKIIELYEENEKLKQEHE